MIAGAHKRLTTVREQHVPAEYRDSFLYRNPVHRELLALAQRLGV